MASDKMLLWGKIYVSVIFSWIFLLLNLHECRCSETALRRYEVPASVDTFLHGNSGRWESYDYLEIGVRTDRIESRALVKFDINKFMLDVRWGDAWQLSNVNRSAIISASLKLSCRTIIKIDSTNPRDRFFRGTLNVGRILVDWEESAATSMMRTSAGDMWYYDNLGTNWTDATPPVASAFVDMDYHRCLNGETVQFDLKGVLQDWLDGYVANYGLVLWSNDAWLSGKLVKFASSDGFNGHPVLMVTIQDTLAGISALRYFLLQTIQMLRDPDQGAD